MDDVVDVFVYEVNSATTHRLSVRRGDALVALATPDQKLLATLRTRVEAKHGPPLPGAIPAHCVQGCGEAGMEESKAESKGDDTEQGAESNAATQADGKDTEDVDPVASKGASMGGGDNGSGGEATPPRDSFHDQLVEDLLWQSASQLPGEVFARRLLRERVHMFDARDSLQHTHGTQSVRQSTSSMRLRFDHCVYQGTHSVLHATVADAQDVAAGTAKPYTRMLG